VTWIQGLSDVDLLALSTHELGGVTRGIFGQPLEAIPCEPLSDIERRHLRAWLSYRHVCGLFKRDCEIMRGIFGAASGVQ